LFFKSQLLYQLSYRGGQVKDNYLMIKANGKFYSPPIARVAVFADDKIIFHRK